MAEIEEAVKTLSREEPAKLAAYIAKQDKPSWDEQLEEELFARRQARFCLGEDRCWKILALAVNYTRARSVV